MGNTLGRLCLWQCFVSRIWSPGTTPWQKCRFSIIRHIGLSKKEQQLQSKLRFTDVSPNRSLMIFETDSCSRNLFYPFSRLVNNNFWCNFCHKRFFSFSISFPDYLYVNQSPNSYNVIILGYKYYTKHIFFIGVNSKVQNNFFCAAFPYHLKSRLECFKIVYTWWWCFWVGGYVINIHSPACLTR